jgi:transcriptional regulator of heat shock response
MNNRQEQLLKLITLQYIKTAEPVSSKLIAQADDFDLSSATIRNEMMELENAGFIYQPYTSAGRIPTEKGYSYFVSHFLKDFFLSKKQQQVLAGVIKTFKKFEPQLAKELAKEIAEFSAQAVFVAFSDDDFYYTGLANLFSQPEFIEHQPVYHLSQVIDHLDQVINKIFNLLETDLEILIGSQNPFGKDCSCIVAKYYSQDAAGLFGILGPMRMDYQNNYNLIKYSQQLIKELDN